MRTKLLLAICLVITFAAGMTAGVLVGRSTKPPRRGSWLTDELKLTSEQQKQMRSIWSDVFRRSRREPRDNRRAAEKERDEAIQKLLADTQKPQYEAITKTFEDRMVQLGQERQKLFDEAVRKTKQILTPAQRVKYEEIMKRPREQGHRGPRDKGPFSPPPHPGAGPDGQKAQPGDKPEAP